MIFKEQDVVYLMDWYDSEEDTYRILSFFESKNYGPSAHLIGLSGLRVGQYRSIPLSNLRKISRLENRGRGKWVVVTPDGKEMTFSSKNKAVTASKKKGLLVKER